MLCKCASFLNVINSVTIMKEEENVNEPSTPYQSRMHVHVSHSLEEMNETTAKAMASLSSEQHLKNATAMIKHIYAEQLLKPMNKKLTFEE